ncbi:hypothetical protein OS493_018283 [Desmophyllum pertusum]|uniref:Uncharacterized protein n=1 Tax=Desmophyllum pertusum TaxID=174260 RepID=A0A9W9YBX8_9CNID|nr:hypothetical protein OS493_018283 [Desmophyllum pertusum]
MLDDKCKFCVQKVQNLPGVSTLRVTPYRDTDFGNYKCKARNKLGFQHITIKLRQDKTKRHKIADAVDGGKGMHCTKPKDMLVISVIVLVVASVVFLLVFDVVCHVTRNKGVLNRLIRRRNRHRKYSTLTAKDKTNSTETQDQENSTEKEHAAP